MKLITINGAIILFLANFLGKIFGAIYRIPLSNLLGPEGMGLYQMAFPLYAFLLTFVTSGISITLTRKIAKLRASNNINEISKVYSMGKGFSKFSGFILTGIIILLAYPLSYIQGNPNVFYCYLIIAVGFIFACNLSANRGYFQGYGNMIPTATSQLIEQIFKLILGLIFAYLFSAFGTVFGVVGALLGVVFGELFAILFFKIKFRNKNVYMKYSKLEYLSFIKESISVGVNYSILPLYTLIDSFLIVNLLKLSGVNISISTELYGIYSGMILPLINMPNVLISAIALTSIPKISYMIANKEDLKDKINGIFKFTFMFILPCAVGMFFLSEVILRIVYPTLELNQLNIAVNLLKYSTFEMFFLCFLSITNSIMQAIDKTKLSTHSLLVGIILKAIIMLISIPNNNISIYGASISNIFAYFIPCFINLYFIKKHTNSRVGIKYIIMPVISVLIMAVVIQLIRNVFVDISFIGLLATIIISAGIYFLFLFFVRQWNFNDIKKLLQNK